MLVLSRKEGQDIIVNDGQLVLKVLEIKQGRVRLGIEADMSFQIQRREVFERNIDQCPPDMSPPTS